MTKPDANNGENKGVEGSSGRAAATAIGLDDCICCFDEDDDGDC